MSAYAKATARQSSLHSTTRAKTGGKGIRTPDFQLAKLALYQLSYAPVLMIAKCGLSIGGCKEQSVGGVAAPSAGQRSYPGNLSANTSAFSIFGGCARSSGAFSIKALATFPDRCASHPASSRNASKMAKVVGLSLIPNQAVVAGSCCTKPCASRKNFATSFSFPGFASSLTNNAFVVMGDLLVTVLLSNCRNRIYLSVSVEPNEIPSDGGPKSSEGRFSSQ